MQIWRITRPAPGKTCMKARLVSLDVLFVDASPEKSCFVVDLVCSSCVPTTFYVWMPREGIEVFHRSPRKLRENSGDEEKEFTFAAELKFIRYISG